MGPANVNLQSSKRPTSFILLTVALPSLDTRCPMRRTISTLLVLFTAAASANAAGLLVPDDVKLPPLAMVHHRVNIAIEDQVAVTTIEQAFRNHTDRQLEATYLFP